MLRPIGRQTEKVRTSACRFCCFAQVFCSTRHNKVNFASALAYRKKSCRSSDRKMILMFFYSLRSFRTRHTVSLLMTRIHIVSAYSRFLPSSKVQANCKQENLHVFYLLHSFRTQHAVSLLVSRIHIVSAYSRFLPSSKVQANCKQENLHVFYSLHLLGHGTPCLYL